MIQDLHDLAPGMVPVLEAMVLDGVEERADVASYVHASLYGVGLTPEGDAEATCLGSALVRVW